LEQAHAFINVRDGHLICSTYGKVDAPTEDEIRGLKSLKFLAKLFSFLMKCFAFSSFSLS
jgi:hypothetical protein